MMRKAVDYYVVLGVPRDVSPEDLKKRYRQLVRQYHPDVVDDPEAAHDHFILLVEAYRVLAEPARRRAYDAMQAGVTAPPATRSVQLQRQVDDWFRHAVHRLEQNDLGGAAAQCRKILAVDSRHAAAQAMLGDVHATREEWDQALVLYSGAVSAAPRNAIYARKLRTAAEGGQRARAAEERRQKLAGQRAKAVDALNARHEYAPYAAIFGAAWVLVMLAWVANHPGEPLAPWCALPGNVALVAAGAGLLSGVVLACVGLGREPGEAPGGLTWLLGGLGLLSFYLGLAVFCVWTMVRGRVARSLAAACAVSALLVVTLTALLGATQVDSEVWRAVALLSGNVIFPCALLGQGLGRLGLRAT